MPQSYFGPHLKMLNCTFTSVLLTLISLIIGAKCKSQLSFEEVWRTMLIKFLFMSQKYYLGVFQQLGWILDMGHGFLGSFSQLIFVNPISSISDTQLSYIIGDITTSTILKNSYKQYIFGSLPSSFTSK